MILIDLKDSRPIYEQVVERFKILILRGAIEPDEKLPSVRNLAVDLSINFALDRENLLGRYKEEILKQLKEICRTALSVGMTETEIIDNIRGWGKL